MRLVHLLATAAGLVLASTSHAGWSAAAGGTASAAATELGTGATPVATAPPLSLTITVTWGPTALADGYTVRRYNSLGVTETTGGTCAGTVTALSCTETVLTGAYRYAVTPRRNGWSGPEGGRSTTLTVPHN